MKTGPKPKPISERILRKVIVDAVTECWEWTGSRNAHGYGSMVIGSRSQDRRTIGAHRASFEAFNGPIPDGMHVCHRCDNPACVNPGHLFLGDRSDNMRDMVAKGRGRQPDAGRTVCINGHPVTPGEDCQGCRREASKRYRERHREAERERARRNYWANPEPQRERSRAAYHRRK